MVQSNHIQYMIKYFIKYCNYLNHFKSIFSLCNILLLYYFFTNVLFNHLKSIKKCSLKFVLLHYLTVELPYYEYNLQKFF
jgi:hypothetical protein